MTDGMNTIRFKRGQVEFEFTGTREDVAKVWADLEPLVVRALEQGRTPEARTGRTPGSDDGPDGTSTESDRESILREGSLEDFPIIDSSTPAREAGYAVLAWAADHDVPEMSTSEIHEVLSERLRIPHSPNAYREAFRRRQREVARRGRNPQLFRLLGPGRTVLEEYLKTKE